MDSRAVMKVVLPMDKYDLLKKTFRYHGHNPGEVLYLKFLLHPTGRVNITYIPVMKMDHKEYGDLYTTSTKLGTRCINLIEKSNQTCTHPDFYTEHNVWVFICLYLIFFNLKFFVTIANRFVPRLRWVSRRAFDIMEMKYDIAKKVLLATYFINCFIFMEVFKANLSTKMTVDIDHNINYLDDIFKHPKMRIILDELEKSYFYTKWTRQDLYTEYKRRLKKSPIGKSRHSSYDAFNKGNAAYISSITNLEYFCYHFYKSLHYGKDPFLLKFDTTLMSKNASTLIKDVINKRLMHFWETGHQILAYDLMNKKSCSKYLQQKKGMEFSKTSLSDISVVFVVFAALIMVSIMVFSAEIWYACRNTWFERALRRMEMDIYTG